MASEIHAFNVGLAEKYGIVEAILIQHFQTWINVNMRNGTNFRDGKTWSYQTLENIRSTFPYLKEEQLRAGLDRLCNGKSRKQQTQQFDPVLIKGNFNEHKYDRTIWYAFIDESKFTIGKKPQKDLGDIPNGIGRSPRPIPDITPDVTKKEKKQKKSSSGGNAPSSDASRRLSNLLLLKIQENDPKFKEPNLEKWAQELDRMNRIDKRSWKEIEELILYATSNDFWQTNILCPQKLRKQASRLTIQMSKDKPKVEKENATEAKIKANKEYIDSLIGICQLEEVKVTLYQHLARLEKKDQKFEIYYDAHGFKEQIDNILRKLEVWQ